MDHPENSQSSDSTTLASQQGWWWGRIMDRIETEMDRGQARMIQRKDDDRQDKLSLAG